MAYGKPPLANMIKPGTTQYLQAQVAKQQGDEQARRKRAEEEARRKNEPGLIARGLDAAASQMQDISDGPRVGGLTTPWNGRLGLWADLDTELGEAKRAGVPPRLPLLHFEDMDDPYAIQIMNRRSPFFEAATAALKGQKQLTDEEYQRRRDEFNPKKSLAEWATIYPEAAKLCENRTPEECRTERVTEVEIGTRLQHRKDVEEIDRRHKAKNSWAGKMAEEFFQRFNPSTSQLEAMGVLAEAAKVPFAGAAGRAADQTLSRSLSQRYLKRLGLPYKPSERGSFTNDYFNALGLKSPDGRKKRDNRTLLGGDNE